MIKYAKIINDEKGLCEVGAGSDTEFYKSLGMIPLDVCQSEIDAQWYLSEKCPSYTDEEKLEKAKKTKYTEASQGAKAYLESGNALYELTPTQHIEATDGNIGKLGAYALGFVTGLYGADDVVFWNTKEDETITLNQEQLTQAIAGLGEVQAQVWNVKFPQYLAQIEACTTADEVNAIVIDYAKEPEHENQPAQDNTDISQTPSTADV